MNLEIKKDLTSNWFRILQNAFCDDIIKLEKINLSLNPQYGKEVIIKTKVEENFDYYKTAKYLKKSA